MKLAPFTSRALRVTALGVALAGALGCASRPDADRKNVEAFERDQRPTRLLELGKAFAARGDLTRAEQYFEAALDAGADAAVVIPLLLHVCVRDGRYRAALAHGEDHLRKHPNDARTRFVLATILAGLGEGPAARGELERVVKERPADPEAHFALAVLLREHFKDPVSADPYFRQYLKLAPRGSHAEEAQASLMRSVP